MKSKTQTLIVALFALALVPAIALADSPPADGQDAPNATSYSCCKTLKDGSTCEVSLEVQELLERAAARLAFEKSQDQVDKGIGWDIHD